MIVPITTAQLSKLQDLLPFWGSRHDYACILQSNQFSSACNHDTYEFIAGFANHGAKVYTHTKTIDQNESWKLGYLTYEYQHALHGINVLKAAPTGFSDCFFFVPQILFYVKRNSLELEISGTDARIINEILDFKIPIETPSIKNLQPRISKEHYIQNIEKIKEKIVDGDFYEINFCMDFFSIDSQISPPHVFKRLNQISPTPFAAFIKHDSKYLLSASPERFLKRSAQQIIAQPIKGTIRRSTDFNEDEHLKTRLLQSEKERAENIMIVDLMRNDLARCAETGSVKAEELLGLYTFATVHQLISTVSATLVPDISFDEILKNTFPMGSMTGAPKREVMHMIDALEQSARGIFSGSVGYIAPNKDFDFNVVIRSIVYNEILKYLSLHVGSAITYDADAEQEYHECLLKSRTMRKALQCDIDFENLN